MSIKKVVHEKKGWTGDRKKVDRLVADITAVIEVCDANVRNENDELDAALICIAAKPVTVDGKNSYELSSVALGDGPVVKKALYNAMKSSESMAEVVMDVAQRFAVERLTERLSGKEVQNG